MECKHCGSNVPDGASVCPTCGATTAPASAGMFKRPGDIGAGGFTLSDEPVSPTYTPAPSPTCPACGAPLSATDKFCTKCGTPSPLCSDDAAKRLSGSGVRVNIGSSRAPSGGGSAPASGSTPVSADVPPVDTEQPPEPYVPPVAKPSESPASAFLQGLCASPLYLVATIFCSVLALFTLVSNGSTLIPTLPYLEGEMLAVMLFSLVYTVGVVVCWVVGMWVLFGAAHGTLKRGPACGGLTTIKVAFIVSLSMELVALAYGLFKLVQSGFFETLEFWELYPTEAKAVMLGTLVGIVIGLTLRFTLEAKIIRMTSSTARAVSYGTVSPVPSAFVGVMMFIIGILTFILPFVLVFYMAGELGYRGSYGELVSQMFSGMGALGLLSWLVNVVSSILLGVLTFNARKRWQASQIAY